MSHHGRTFSILSLPSVILIDSSTGSAVHVLMLSIQAVPVRDLPRLRAPGIVPCVISFSLSPDNSLFPQSVTIVC